MAYGAEPAGPGALAHTIYIRPSPELIARSWHWPACWHRAFEYATAELGLAAATCILNGLRLTKRLIALQLSIESVKFRVRRRGASIYIAVLEFTGPETGPDAPGPDGGCQQPRSADGLGLGLRGSGKTFHLVVFHGYMPAVPAQNVLQLNLFDKIMPRANDKDHAVHSTDQLRLPGEYCVKAESECVQANPVSRIIVTNDDRAVRHRPATHRLTNPGPSLCLSPQGANARKRNDFCGRMSWRCWLANASRPPAHTVGAEQCCCSTPAPHSQSGVPFDSCGLSWGQCILSHLERVEATPFSYPTSDTAGGMPFLEKTALCDWRLRLQKPLSNQLPDHCLH
jgi:hypothetical protein